MTCPVLRDYQVDVIRRGRQRIAEGARRVIIQAPTGAGKTHISSEMVRCAVAKGKRVLFLAHRRRLIQQKSERLALFGVQHGILMDGYPLTEHGVQVASRDTLLSRCFDGAGMQLPKADLVIPDEAHNWDSGESQKLLSCYPDAVVVGLTATPAKGDGRGLGTAYWQALECTVPTSRLVREGHLVPVRCYAPDHNGCGKRVLKGDPVTSWQKYAEGLPTVVFSSRKVDSLAVVEAFKAAGIDAEHIDAFTTDRERDDVIDRVRSGRTKVVSNVGIWTEGVDIPELGCCQLLRLAGSRVLYAQAVGRVMRPHGSKTHAVLIDHAGACLVHGMPDEDTEWSLDTDESVDDRYRAKRKKGDVAKPHVCPKCHLLFSGSHVCPSCGFALQRQPQLRGVHDGMLREVERGRKVFADREALTREWKRCLAIMYHKGQTCGAAAGMFARQTGQWPGPAGMMNLPIGQWNRKVRDVYPEYGRPRAAA